MLKNQNEESSIPFQQSLNYDYFIPFKCNLNNMSPLNNNKIDDDYESMSVPQDLSVQVVNKASDEKIFKLLKKFINKLRNSSYIFSNGIKERVGEFLSEKYLSYKIEDNLESQLLFNPQNEVMEAIQFIVYYIALLLSAFLFGFQSLNTFYIDSFGLCLMLLCIINCCIQMNTAYIEDEKIIFNRKQIVMNYLSNNMIYDFIFTTLTLIMTIEKERYILIILYIIILRKSMQGQLINQFDLISLTLNLFQLTHLLACIWYYIGTLRDDGWVNSSGKMYLSNLDAYLHSIFQIFAIITHIDIIECPNNIYEHISYIIIMIISLFIYAYLITKLFVMCKRQIKQQNKKQQNLYQLKQYNKLVNIPTRIKVAAKCQLDKITYCEKQNINNCTSLLFHQQQSMANILSTSIKQDFNILTSTFVFNHIKQLSWLKSTQQLYDSISEIVLEPNTIIFNQGDQEEQSLYLINQGSVTLYESNSNSQIKILNKNQVFGEICFFTGQPRQCSAKSNGYIKLFKIDKTKFIQALNQEEYEQFKQICHKMAFNPSIQCFACNKIGHTINTCKLIFYKPNITKLICQYNNSKNNRAKHKRLDRLKMRAFSLYNQSLRSQHKSFSNKEQSSISSECDSPQDLQRSTVDKFNSYDPPSIDFLQNAPSIKEAVSLGNGNYNSSKKVSTLVGTIPVSYQKIQDRGTNKDFPSSTLPQKQMLFSDQFQFQTSLQSFISIEEFDRVYNFRYFLVHNNFENTYQRKRGSTFFTFAKHQS